MKHYRLFKNENGTTIILFVGIIAGILAFSSLITDVGYVMVKKSRLKNTADAAALAAVSKMSEDRTKARDSGLEYIGRNGNTGITNEILIPDTGYIATVKLKKNVFYFFARLMGYNKTDIYVQSTAKMAPVVAVRGLRPLAIQQQTLKFGEEYTLKEGAGSGQTGNYGAVSLGGTGATRYMENLKYGYDEVIRIGDYIKTETGNMSGPTQEGITYLVGQCDHYPKCTYLKYVPNCPRLVTIPVVNTLDVDGKKPIVAVGFASFFIEDYIDNDGHSQIAGRFIQTIIDGEMGDGITDFGTRSIKLIE